MIFDQQSICIDDYDDVEGKYYWAVKEAAFDGELLPSKRGNNVA